MRKNLVSLVLASAIGLISCNTVKHSREEKEWLAAMIIGQAGDYLSTKQCLDTGDFEEANPLFKDENDVLIGKAGIVSLMYVLGQFYPENRKTYYKIGAFGGFVPMGINLYNYNKYKRDKQ